MLLDAALLIAISGAAVYLAMYLRARRRDAHLERLAESERRFRALTELSADWFWEADASHRITWLSGGPPVATFFGHTPTYGKRFWEIPGVEVEPRALAAHLERLERRQAFFDLEIARTDERGARQVHIVSGRSRLGPGGELLGYRGVGRDVTEQRSAERSLARAKERLELALDGGNLAEWHFDCASGELYAGDGWVRFLGHEQSPPVTSGEALFDLVNRDDIAATRQALIRALKGEAAHYDVEFRLRTRGGEWKWLHARGRVTERDAAGRAKRMSGIVADIDDRKRAESATEPAKVAAALAASEQRFSDIERAAGEYVWETDARGRYTYLSERVERILGYSRAELLGRKPRELMPLGEDRAVAAWLAEQGEGQPFRDLVHRSIPKWGGVVWQSVSGVPVRDATGALIGWRGTAADVTARKQAEARIEQLATRDALTGLANRALLAERAAQAIVAAARGRGALAVLAIDLDRFKLVNQALGHAVGDALLRAVAERLQNVHREATLARLGGDEYVLIQAVKDAEEATSLAQRVLSVLARAFTVEGRVLHVGASIGIALYPEHGRDFGELLKNADAAMYDAKASGRGTWRLFTPALAEQAAERLRTENELRGALARSELVLHWHPVVRGRGRVVGAEALVRWRHPERGLLMPEQFVPLAEESGLIGAVGEWTLERALSQAGAWQATLPGSPWFAVNVSAPELARGEAYVEKLKRCLQENKLEGSRVELEVTERVILAHVPENLETLRRIGALGVRLAIDDFGTGYSSLAYLRRLPIHKLKIDRMFLRGLETDAADRAIVRTIASLATTLGLAVAAEGVDTAAQLERLLELGCEEWQGHYFSEPLTGAELEALIRRQGRISA